MPMLIDVRGRVQNTPLRLSQALLPLFEAVINSIHAIEAANNEDGQIKIAIRRQPSLKGLESDSELHTYSPIIGFDVTDNGIGFTTENYNSFNTADTRLKEHFGGKGVGRFLWLKAFEHAHISSVFEEGGLFLRREFDFTIWYQGTEGDRLLDASGQARRTTVRLQNFKSEYSEHVPQSAKKIALRIVEHCLKYFVLNRTPTILLEDQEHESEVINLNLVYKELVDVSSSTKLVVENQEFELRHFMLHSQPDLKHRFNYCAHHRVVLDKPLDRKIPNLARYLPAITGEGLLVYAGYISSSFLDSHVNQQRTGFDLLEEGELKFPGELNWNEIESAVVSACTEFLLPYTNPVKEEKEERIKNFVATKAPQYRNLVHQHPETLNSIPPDVTEQKLDIALYEKQKEKEIALRKTANDLLQQTRQVNPKDQETVAELHRRTSEFLEQWNGLTKDKLADYIIQRKMTLDLLGEHIEKKETGRYSLESVVHGLIFPLKTTSDRIDYERQNLWIIDEKLAYHSYLASDLPMSKNEVLVSSSLDRPDLIIFDNLFAWAVGERPFTSIVLVEFKRPMRDDYDVDHNPIDQVLRYVRQIRANKVYDNRGRTLNLPEKIPFYAYIIADLTDSLRYQCESVSLDPTSDNLGYFGYNRNFGIYFEVIDYDKLVQDAKRRNAILFEKLGLIGTDI